VCVFILPFLVDYCKSDCGINEEQIERN